MCELLEWSLSKLEQVTGEPGSQDLAELVGQSVNLLSGVAEDKTLAWSATCPRLPSRIRA